MKKNSLLIPIALVVTSFAFSACQARLNKPSEITNEAQTTDTQLNEPEAVVSEDNSLDALEQELEETTILEEDFGDLE